ncbi:dephospho-CoA kinase [Tenacibaculum dicentrarchi]|uniref:Dephospho-CoA kinase n=1 Tax=Tenacibaculum dicentrarchi TaxID=669041 RepID=A0ABM9NTT0_9FLAO|nr:Dephospho-CoA kinase [Tenacibaculum dicentrarchi]SOU86682.1 Dephospho-CoA kinase [Tenacibaculum dicentrarchi]
MVIGLTGGIGSGKSTVVKMFAEYKNSAIYIADNEAKKLMNSSDEIKTKLIAEFGENVYKNKLLNKPFLADIVFNDKDKLATLNSIVHPVVNNHFQVFIRKNADKNYILYENAILFENGSNIFCDKIITVTAPENIRIERVLKRDNTTTDAIKNRINNQWSQIKKTLQSHYIIENITRKNTQYQVDIIHAILTKKVIN